jgi:hypothetical protein
MLKRIFGHKKDRRWRNCITFNLVCTLHQEFLGDKRTEDGMGWACSRIGKTYIQYVVWET